MREQGLVPAQVRAFRLTTTVQGDFRGIPDLLGRDFTAERPGTKLVGDITSWESHRGSGRVQVELSAGDHSDITDFV
ncbi:hypothetical protein [Streptosporangium amethystogenes]|uniref:hypothetical protein n=1 Tax=Streptosporangium amethystogenes TaxID=2002 RepID=UPI00068C4194|nr:hypothetical protein [Streptosporangium amethystogenes]